MQFTEVDPTGWNLQSSGPDPWVDPTRVQLCMVASSGVARFHGTLGRTAHFRPSAGKTELSREQNRSSRKIYVLHVTMSENSVQPIRRKSKKLFSATCFGAPTCPAT
jgi:hypothetical protein